LSIIPKINQLARTATASLAETRRHEVTNRPTSIRLCELAHSALIGPAVRFMCSGMTGYGG
jgi:hypothetical protein